MRRLLSTVAAAALLFAACGGSAAPTANPTPTATPAPTATPTLAPTPTPTPTPTLAPTPTPPPADTGWITFAPKGAGFTAKLPGQPKLTTTKTKTPFGNAPTSLWTYEQSAHEAYFIAKVVYPAGALAGKSASAVYDGALTGMESSTGATLDQSGDFTVGTHTGRNFILSTASMKMAGGLVLVSNTLYMAYAAYDSSASSDTVQAFLNDFTLTV